MKRKKKKISTSDCSTSQLCERKLLSKFTAQSHHDKRASYSVFHWLIQVTIAPVESLVPNLLSIHISQDF